MQHITAPSSVSPVAHHPTYTKKGNARNVLGDDFYLRLPRCAVRLCCSFSCKASLPPAQGTGSKAKVNSVNSRTRHRTRAMTEAEVVMRNESGYITHTGKKDFGPLEFTGKIAGGLRLDLRRRAPLFCSDWTDAFTPDNFQKSVSSILYLRTHIQESCCFKSSETLSDSLKAKATVKVPFHRCACARHHLREPLLGWNQWAVWCVRDDHVDSIVWRVILNLCWAALVHPGCNWPFPGLHSGGLRPCSRKRPRIHAVLFLDLHVVLALHHPRGHL